MEIIVYDDERKNGKEFVGIQIEENKKIKVFLPLGYKYIKGEENTDEFKRNITKLLLLISQKSIMKFHKDKTSNIDFDIISALKIISNYRNYGLYKQSEIKTNKNFKGRNNWKKTMHENQIYTKEKVIYINIVKEYIDYQCEKTIQEIQQWCLYKISNIIGPLFNFYYPKNINKISKLEMINILEKEIKSTNQDTKIETLTNLLDFIKNTNFEKENEINILLNYKEFQIIFQDLVNSVGVDNKKRKQYYPEAQYCYWNNDSVMQKTDSLEPDTIVEKGEFLFILDAKYKSNLPNEYEIFKQIRYEEYAKWKYISEKLQYKECLKTINAFILPGNLQNNENGVNIEKYYAKVVGEENKIYVVYVDMKEMINNPKKIMENVLKELKAKY